MADTAAAAAAAEGQINRPWILFGEVRCRMYRTDIEMKDALDRVGMLQRGILDGVIDPVSGADEIVEKMNGVLSALLLTGVPGGVLYEQLLEPLGRWAMDTSLQWMGKEHESRGAALKVCFDKVTALFSSYQHLENAG